MTGKRRKTEANHMAGKFKIKTCWSTIDNCNLGIPWYTWVRLPSSPRRARWCRMHVFFCFALFALLCVRVGSLCVSFPLLPSFFSLCAARLFCVFSRCCEMLFVFLSFSSCLLWLAALVPSHSPLPICAWFKTHNVYWDCYRKGGDTNKMDKFLYPRMCVCMSVCLCVRVCITFR